MGLIDTKIFYLLYSLLIRHFGRKMEYGPHACGGVPIRRYIYKFLTIWSPRMWGCTEQRQIPSVRGTMVPTHVGVYRYGGDHRKGFNHGPHACGGVPNPDHKEDIEIIWSPRMWGCTE